MVYNTADMLYHDKLDHICVLLTNVRVWDQKNGEVFQMIEFIQYKFAMSLPLHSLKKYFVEISPTRGKNLLLCRDKNRKCTNHTEPLYYGHLIIFVSIHIFDCESDHATIESASAQVRWISYEC